MSIIYGVDTTKEVTPIMVRDAVVACFFTAHCAQTELGGNDDKLIKEYCTQIVQKAFSDTNGSFENPTKASIINALPKLADFSKTFRDQTIVQKHLDEILKLMTFLK